MLGVLTYFQALLGRRGFIVALIIVALAPLVWEYSGAFTGYFNAYIQRQLAAVSEEKAKGEADKAAEDARSAKAAADNAERLRVAEAEERVQLAKKAAFDAEAAKELAKKAAADAEAAREVANNAAKLRLAEANERTELAVKAAADAEAAKELAKKAAADAETARATADNSARMQAGLAAKAQEEAETQRQKNKILRAFTDGGGSADEMVQRDFNRQLNVLGMGNDPAPRQQEDTPTNQPQVPPKCRQAYANWQVRAHGVFASIGNGNCAWNGVTTIIDTIGEAKTQLAAFCQTRRYSCAIIATK